MEKVNKWYMNRFGQKMSKSSYYDLKNKRAKVLTEAVNGKKKNDYRRKGEDDLATFEDHLRLKIAELTESNNCILWTYPLLQDVALEERGKEPFVHMEVPQKYSSIVFFLSIKLSKIHPSPELEVNPGLNILSKSGFLGNFYFQKSQKSGFLGLRILSPTVYKIPVSSLFTLLFT